MSSHLAKLPHLIGIRCSSGHKSLSFSLDKVVSFRLLISPSCIQLLLLQPQEVNENRTPVPKHHLENEKIHVFIVNNKRYLSFRTVTLLRLVLFSLHTNTPPTSNVMSYSNGCIELKINVKVRDYSCEFK